MSSHISNELLANAILCEMDDTAVSVSSDFRGCVGDAVLFIVSTAGTITVSQQCSIDNETFYNPLTITGAATGVIRSALTVTGGVYVPFTPILCPYTRFLIIETGTVEDTNVTLRLLFRTEV